jgi:hypothetical protein
LVELLDRQVKQLLYRSGRSVGEVYRLLGDLLDKLELEDDDKELLIKCRTYLQSSMDVLESQKRL